MANYKINRNKSLPDEEIILKHKNFSKVLSGHQQVVNYKTIRKPLYKNKGLMSFILIVFILLLLFLVSEKDESAPKEKAAKDSIHKMNGKHSFDRHSNGSNSK